MTALAPSPPRAGRHIGVTRHAVLRYRERCPAAADWYAREIICRILWHVQSGESDGGVNGRCRLVRHAGLVFAVKGGRVVTVIRPWEGWDGSGRRRPLERGKRRRLAMAR